jgi:osmotically-inducible protein OsmY
MSILRLVCAAALMAYGATDSAIEQRIKEKFAAGKLASDHFVVKVQQGVATLDGETAVPQRKGAATRIARKAGAREVRNRIKVKSPAASGPPKRAQVLH